MISKLEPINSSPTGDHEANNRNRLLGEEWQKRRMINNLCETMTKLSSVSTVALRVLLLLLPVGAFAASEAGQEIGDPYEPFRVGTIGRVDNAVLAPVGDRLYTLNNGVLRLYNLSPLRIISTKKVEFDSRQTKEDPYRMFVTQDEKRIVLYSRTRLRLLDLKNGKIIKTVPFRSELGVLNGDEIFTLDNNNRATVWNADELTKKKEFVSSGEERWSRVIQGQDVNVTTNLTITDGQLIKTDKHIVLHRPTISNASGQVFIFDSMSYRQIWNLNYLNRIIPAISYDLNTLYIGTYLPKLWRSGGYADHIKEFKNINTGARINEILEIDITTAQVKSSMSLKEFQHSLHLLPTLSGDFVVISPTQRYFLKASIERGPRNSYAFFYREKKFKLFRQFEDGEAVLISKAGYFQATENARKHLIMKNSKGEIVPINDVTFEKFNKSNLDHKEW